MASHNLLKTGILTLLTEFDPTFRFVAVKIEHGILRVYLSQTKYYDISLAGFEKPSSLSDRAFCIQAKDYVSVFVAKNSKERMDWENVLLRNMVFAEKELGSTAYEMKDFEAALKHYKKAIELDPHNIIHRNDEAAVHFENKDYDKCIEVCQQAVEIGREHRADFKFIAKSFARKGTAYYEKNDLKHALTAFNNSLSAHRDPDVFEKAEKVEKAMYETSLATNTSSNTCQFLQMFEQIKKGGKTILREGKFGTINVVVREIKVEDKDRYKREVTIHKLTSGVSNILQMFLNTSSANQSFIVFEQHRTDLSDVEFLRDLTSEDTRSFALQLLESLTQLENMGIIHCSLEPAHVLVNERCGRRRLLVSNLRRALHISQYPGREGLPEPNNKWSAPEVRKSNATFNFAADVWSMALIILHVIEKGREVPRDSTGAICRENLHLPDDYNDMIYNALDPNEIQRIKAEDMLRYPIFWTISNRLQFFNSLHQFIFRKRDFLPEVDRQLFNRVLNMYFSWFREVDKDYLKSMNSYKLRKRLRPYSVDLQSFVMFNRNLLQHFKQITENIKESSNVTKHVTALDLISTGKMIEQTNKVFAIFRPLFDAEFIQEMWL